MNRREVALDIIARISGKDRSILEPRHELVADLGLDSAKALELLVNLEDRLEIEIDDDVVGDLNTVGDILAHLDALDGGSG